MEVAVSTRRDPHPHAGEVPIPREGGGRNPTGRTGADVPTHGSLSNLDATRENPGNGETGIA